MITSFMENLIREITDRYRPVSLEEMESVKLMDRVETKFVFSIDKLPRLLSLMETDYRIMETAGNRLHAYDTVYFDTPGLNLYRVHHQGKLNRYKIRFRRYCDSDLCFFEVKFKNNKGRTIKKRIKHAGFSRVIEGKAEKLMKDCTPFDPASMVPVMETRYNRMTFVNRDMTERITIDTGLTFCKDDQKVTIGGLCIAEVKQQRSSLAGIPCLMHRLEIRQMSVSKFCLGIIHMYPGIRKNNLKPKLLRIQKILKNVS